MILRIILSAMLIIPFAAAGFFLLLNIGNEINENKKDMKLNNMAKREKREMIARQDMLEQEDIQAHQERFFRT